MTALPPTLITGAANRIGKAIAIDLAKAGTPVCIHYNHSAGAAEQVADYIRASGGQAATAQANLLSDSDVSALAGKASSALGMPLGCLVNSASLFEADSAGSLAPDLFHKHFTIHATAAAVLSDHMVNQLPSDAHGMIVNVIDQRVWSLTPNFISYTASKVALWGLTQTLAQAYAQSTGGRVRVNAIGPGPTLANPRQDPKDFQKQVDAVPLAVGPDLDAFAKTLTYLWQMKAMTGQMIALDGGQHLAWETPDIVGIKE